MNAEQLATLDDKEFRVLLFSAVKHRDYQRALHLVHNARGTAAKVQAVTRANKTLYDVLEVARLSREKRNGNK